MQTTKEIALGQLFSAAHLDMINLEQPSEPIAINRGGTSTIEKGIISIFSLCLILVIAMISRGSDILLMCLDFAELSLASIQQIASMQHHNLVTDTNPSDETKEHTRRHKKMKKVINIPQVTLWRLRFSLVYSFLLFSVLFLSMF